MVTTEIDPSALADLLRRSNGRFKKLLIVDCRCFMDYNNSHIRDAINAFYSKLVRRRLQENKVGPSFLLQQLLMCGEDKAKKIDQISSEIDLVIYDETTDTANSCELFKPSDANSLALSSTETKNVVEMFEKGQTVSNASECAFNRIKRNFTCKKKQDSLLQDNSNKFRALLIEKLRHCKAFSQIMVLKGGFCDFRERYPDLCEGAATTLFDGSRGLSMSHHSGQLHQQQQQQQLHEHQQKERPALSSLSQPCLPINCEGPTRILPFLYLGSQQDAMNEHTLKKHGIDYVINLSLNCPRPAQFAKEEHFLRIPVNDSYQEKLLPYFDSAFQFLDKVRETNSCVLVHCLAGISRSPTVAIAYIMKQCNMTTDEAYTYVKAKRPSISPNFNFMGQLLEFEKLLKERRSKDIAKLLGSSRPPPASSPFRQAKTSDVQESTTDMPQKPTFLSETTSVNMGSAEQIRRCLSCPVKIQKSASSGELRAGAGWLDMDAQTPGSVTNENGKRKMCVPKSASRSQDSTYSSACSALEEEEMVNDEIPTVDDNEAKEAPNKVNEMFDMTRSMPSWPTVERPKGLGNLKARRVLHPPCPAVKEDLPSPSSQLSRLSFTSPFCHSRPPSICCPQYYTSSSSSPIVEKVVIDSGAALEKRDYDKNEQYFAHFSSTNVNDPPPAQNCALSSKCPSSSSFMAKVQNEPRQADYSSKVVFASNPFFAATIGNNETSKLAKSEKLSSAEEIVIEQPKNSVENFMFPDINPRQHYVPKMEVNSGINSINNDHVNNNAVELDNQSAKIVPEKLTFPHTLSGFSSKLAQFLRRGPWLNAIHNNQNNNNNNDNSGVVQGMLMTKSTTVHELAIPSLERQRNETETDFFTHHPGQKSSVSDCFEISPAKTTENMSASENNNKNDQNSPNKMTTTTTTVDFNLIQANKNPTTKFNFTTTSHDKNVPTIERSSSSAAPSKSQSESALLYAIELDSPESGFVESPLRETSSIVLAKTFNKGHKHNRHSSITSSYGRDPERESLGSSTSSLEITAVS